MLARRRNAKGFTLVELLVVIGIIALLAAMLLPVLARATGSAKSTRCKNQLNQLYKGLRMYLNNFDEYFPVSFLKGSDADDATLYGYMYHRFNVYEHSDNAFNHIVATANDREGSASNKFKATRLFWECPAEGYTKEYFAPKIVFKEPAAGATSFDQQAQYNSLVANVASTERPLLTDVDASYPKPDAEPKPDQAAHAAELHGGWLMASGVTGETGKGAFTGAGDSLRTANDYTTSRFDFRHNDNINVVFLDSHVVGVRKDDGSQLKRIYDRWNKMSPTTVTP
jgi:prepilin-type N-terminal cleavage/methylation domain-containing protein/prepilin-type processing-associated H-X9-DG protein